MPALWAMFTTRASIIFAVRYFFLVAESVTKAADENPTLSVRVPIADHEAFITNAERLGSTKDIVFRALVRAFNEACAGGRRPVMPFHIDSPAYLVEEGRVVDATYITKGVVGGPAQTIIVPHSEQRRTRTVAEIEAEALAKREAARKAVKK